VLIPQVVTIDIYNILYNIIIYMHFIINEQLLAYGYYSTYIYMFPGALMRLKGRGRTKPGAIIHPSKSDAGSRR
jgi:hypothetical protein